VQQLAKAPQDRFTSIYSVRTAGRRSSSLLKGDKASSFRVRHASHLFSLPARPITHPSEYASAAFKSTPGSTVTVASKP